MTFQNKIGFRYTLFFRLLLGFLIGIGAATVRADITHDLAHNNACNATTSASAVTSTAHEAGLEAKTAHKLGAIASALPAFWNEYNVGVGTTSGMNAASAVKDGIINRLKAEADLQALEQQEAQRQAAQAAEEKAAEEQAASAEQRKRDGAAKQAKERQTDQEAVDVREFTQENYFGNENAELSGLFAKTQQAQALVAESSECLERPKGETGSKSPPIKGTTGQKITQVCKDTITQAKERHDNACEALKKNPTHLGNLLRVDPVFLAWDCAVEGLGFLKDELAEFIPERQLVAGYQNVLNSRLIKE